MFLKIFISYLPQITTRSPLLPLHVLNAYFNFADLLPLQDLVDLLFSKKQKKEKKEKKKRFGRSAFLIRIIEAR